jgi:hypothetical protein
MVAAGLDLVAEARKEARAELHQPNAACTVPGALQLQVGKRGREDAAEELPCKEGLARKMCRPIAAPLLPKQELVCLPFSLGVKSQYIVITSDIATAPPHSIKFVASAFVAGAGCMCVHAQK